MELYRLSLRELQTLLQRKELSPVELVEAMRKRIEACAPALNCYLHLNWDDALEAARKADVSLPLGGIPIAVKDAINVKGLPCTAASRMLEKYRSPYDATVVARLRAAGAIPLGKTNMDEFSMGSSNENSAFGSARNPWDLERTPGGSSGGSAAAVAGDVAVAALGSDTGGSVRLPAALTGCVGLKPSYGRVSRYGLIAFASSLDQIGTLTRTVGDAAVLLDTMGGHDPHDSTSLRHPQPDYAALLGREVKGLRLGLPKEYFVSGIDPDVSAAVHNALRQYEAMGAELVEISLPNTEHAIGVYYIIATAEASANLARFDGIRYGHAVPNAKDLLDHYERSRGSGFGDEVKRRILLGTYVLSAGYHDAYYTRAQQIRTLIRRDFERAFEKVDAIVCPTSPAPAFRLGEKADPLQMYLFDIFTVSANLAGICGLSVPCGFSRVGEKSLPVGLQILAPDFREDLLFQVGSAWESVAGLSQQRPVLPGEVR